MTDLLVSSLMADGGLEMALDAAFRKETADMEEAKEHAQEQPGDQEGEGTGLKTQEAVMEAEAKRGQHDRDGDGETSIPLLQLMQQLLRSAYLLHKVCTSRG